MYEKPIGNYNIKKKVMDISYTDTDHNHFINNETTLNPKNCILTF